jgi:hypothetical protein
MMTVTASDAVVSLQALTFADAADLPDASTKVDELFDQLVHGVAFSQQRVCCPPCRRFARHSAQRP